ncbi:MAG: hypothetical protein ACI8W8_002472 [Rhodothermales bacterium]|jgi:hypothetical protein
MPQDLGEARNIAQAHPEVVKQIETYLETARVESPNLPDSAFVKKARCPYYWGFGLGRNVEISERAPRMWPGLPSPGT